ncbi:MAG: type I pullulanase [Bacilli bacterium]|nr:type I pullulanase [Bacilli bacterium]
MKKSLFSALLITILTLTSCGGGKKPSESSIPASEESTPISEESIPVEESEEESLLPSEEESIPVEESSEEVPVSEEESVPAASEEESLLPSEEESVPVTSEPTSEVAPASEESTEPAHPFDVDLGPAPTYEEDSIQIHYFRKDGKYTGWDLWLWERNGNGAGFNFNGQDNWGVIASYPLSTWPDPVTNDLGFLVRKGGDSWSSKDLGGNDMFIEFRNFEKDAKGVYHIYLISGSANIYIDTEGHMKGAISTAIFTKANKITLRGNIKFLSYSIMADGVQIYEEHDLNNGKGSLYKYVTLPSDSIAEFGKTYTVRMVFENGDIGEAVIDKSTLYNDKDFCAPYNYEGDDLGATIEDGHTTFKVWSPASSDIKVRIYDSGTPGEDEHEEFTMTKGEKGVFSYTSDADLSGKYYTYVVTNAANNGREIVDPYAKSAGVNGIRGMIVDFSQTNPDGWNLINVLPYDRKNTVVYETHVSDVTSSDTWTGTEDYRKLFKGMAESGTTYTADGETVPTGFDHIASLGVNAVQIIPLFDQANDEENMTFNWGYNPLNYNVVEGGYSTDPYDGYVRIREFKELVQAYNARGMNIIMDVVYNHVNGANGSNFDVLMPGYYFRYNSTGALSNGSGCGNETASDHYMMKKFMIDSVCFWAKEYKLGGFRFDLMGLHDMETMNELTAAAKEINPDIVIYGEPWTGGDTPLSAAQQAKQSNASKFVGYGQFNDQGRDALIKGGLNSSTSLGWATQKGAEPYSTDLKKIGDALKGITSGATTDPNKTTNYVTCHDNYTLYDRAIATGQFTEADEEELAKLNVLANSVVFCSQGTSFMLAGEEFLRTKGGDSNSYRSSYEVNELDYELATKHSDMINDYRYLISMKVHADQFALEEDDIKEKVEVETSNDYIKLTISEGGEPSIIVFFKNAYGEAVNVEIPANFNLYWSTLHHSAEVTFDGGYQLGNYDTAIFYAGE